MPTEYAEQSGVEESSEVTVERRSLFLFTGRDRYD